MKVTISAIFLIVFFCCLQATNLKKIRVKGLFDDDLQALLNQQAEMNQAVKNDAKGKSGNSNNSKPGKN